MKKNRIKILFVLGSFRLGGGERQMLYLLKMINMKLFEPILLVISTEGALKNELPKYIKTYDLDNKNSNKISLICALLWIVIRVNPAVVYSNLAGTNIPLCIIRLVTKFLGKKTKYIISVLNNVNFYTAKAKRLSYWFYPSMDLVFACAPGLYHQLNEDLNISKEKLKTLYNCVDVNFIKKRSKESVNHKWLKSETPCIITVASLIPQKSIEDLIKSFSIVNSKTKCHLLIIGDGILRSELKSLAVKLNVQDKIDFLGYKANSNKYVARADVFVLTSQFEGLATVLIESAITETPIVCTDAPFGTKDVVVNENMGIRVNVGDTHAIAEGILRMIHDTKYSKMATKNLKKHVENKFSTYKVVKEFEKSILSLIKNSRNKSEIHSCLN